MGEKSDRLDTRLRGLLAQLHVLSEGSTLKLERDHKGKPQSSPPPGAKPEWKGEPDPDDSLLMWFLYKLERASSELDQLALIAQTEIRVQKRIDGKYGRTEAGAFGTAMIETAKERDTRIIRDYRGLHPTEVAAVESERSSFCSPANVRKVRLAKKCDPDTGEPHKGAEGEVTYAKELRRTGLSIGSIALRMGRPKSTVQRWLDRPDGGKKAA